MAMAEIPSKRVTFASYTLFIYLFISKTFRGNTLMYKYSNDHYVNKYNLNVFMSISCRSG